MQIELQNSKLNLEEDDPSQSHYTTCADSPTGFSDTELVTSY